MSFEIKKATRVGVRPLIGVYGESGCGKTYSALLIARGFVGPTGKIVLIDSESGRGSLYADVLPGGYDTLELSQPFSPQNYIAAIEAVEKSGASLGIIDSASHEWEGLGGILEMASEIEEKSGKAGLHCWRKPKLEHAKFMLRMLQSSVPWIVCLRAKYKSRQTKVDGKTQIIKDEATSPIQNEEFIYEMTAHFEILQNHTIILTKCSHPELRKCFPADKTTPISIEHGELIAKWCNDPSGTPAPAKELNSKIKDLAQELWTLLKSVRGSKKDWGEANNWLWANEILDPANPDDIAPNLSESKLKEVIKKSREKLA